MWFGKCNVHVCVLVIFCKIVLDPLLFLLFINDLPDIVKSNAHLFADDCLSYRVINTKTDQLQLQEDLANFEKWEKTWQMSFNDDKCFTLHTTRKRKTVEYNYMLHDHKLEVTTDSKYLGVTISNDLSWATHISNISAKANRTIGFLRCNIHSCPKVHFIVKAATYTTLVRPSIEYASTVWDPYTKNQTMQLDSIHGTERLIVYFNKLNWFTEMYLPTLSNTQMLSYHFGWNTI